MHPLRTTRGGVGYLAETRERQTRFARSKGGRCLMPRNATAPSNVDDELSMSHVDDLIQRGRSQGHLSLAELRTAFEDAGLTPAEGRSILRELSEAGVQLANEQLPEKTRKAAAAPVKGGAKASTAKATAARGPKSAAARAAAERPVTDENNEDQSDLEGDRDADAMAIENDSAVFDDIKDLDDQTPAMGDSVHTYLKSIGRTSLLTAEQEVDLAKRIEAGLFAEHKLDTDPDVTPEVRRDLEMVAEDGRRAKAHMLEANLRLVVSVAKKYSDRGLSLLDVVQEGNLGLIRAVE